MKLLHSTESSRTLNEKQWQDWNQTIFNLFFKIWLITFLVQLLLFLPYKPTEEVSRITYFMHFVLLPSGLEGIVLIAAWLIPKKLLRSHRRSASSLYTIILITSFAGITVCVHTSVSMLPTILLLPMILTPLYKDKFMTLLQAVLAVMLYIMDIAYFTPNSPYILPATPLTPVTDTIIFIAVIFGTYIILERVNEALVLNEERSKRDSLTHLYNHENFYKELSCYLSDYEQSEKGFSIIIADIDNFKKVNDTYGHAFGDEVIKHAAMLFITNEKKGGFSARYGGEEFTMIIPTADPLPVAEKIRSEFEAHAFETTEGVRHFTLSIGAAVYNRKYESASVFFEEADAALYRAKQNGKNQVAV